jgi:hypothetical protein
MDVAEKPLSDDYRVILKTADPIFLADFSISRRFDMVWNSPLA